MNMRLILSSRLQMTALSLVVAGIVGCSREEQAIVIRNVPKQPEPTTRGSMVEPMAMQAQMPGGAAMPPAGNQSGGSIEWSLPDGWKELPGDGGMRFATIVVDPANPTVVLTVIPLNGDSGGVLANVNRWRNQIALQPIVEADLAKNVSEFEIAGGKSYSVNITGPETANPRLAMLAAGIPYKGQTWFLKLAGPANIVSPQKDKFNAFVKSVKFGAADATPKPAAAAAQGQPEMPAGHPAIPGAAPQGQPEMPAGHPAIPGAAPAGQPEMPAGHPAIPGVAAPGAAAAAQAVPFKFEAPAGWVKDEPMPMRTVSFHIGEGASKVDVIVSQLPTMGSGGVVDNVNRWRAQVGLAALPAGQPPVSQPIKVGGSDGQQFDFVGPGAATVAKRQVVAWVTKGQDWWFFKLSGTDEQVSKQLAGFNTFLKSVQFIAANDAAAKP